MRKAAILLGLVLFIGVIFQATIGWSENSIPAERVFVGKNVSFQRYISYNFLVTAGDCGNLEMDELVLSEYPYIDPARWERKNSGEATNKGYYRFTNRENRCDSEFTLHWTLIHTKELHQKLSVAKINPGEIGLLVKDQWERNNYFKLPEDDNLYSFYLAIPGAGVSMTLSAVAETVATNLLKPGKLLGVIVSNDGSGYLNEIIDLRLAKKNVSNWKRMISEGEVVVLGYQD